MSTSCLELTILFALFSSSVCSVQSNWIFKCGKLGPGRERLNTCNYAFFQLAFVDFWHFSLVRLFYYTLLKGNPSAWISSNTNHIRLWFPKNALQLSFQATFVTVFLVWGLLWRKQRSSKLTKTIKTGICAMEASFVNVWRMTLRFWVVFIVIPKQFISLS